MLDKIIETSYEVKYMINVENKINELKKYFEDKSIILAVWIIGSYGTEYQREDSDIDFALLFDEDISLMDEMAISCEISDIIGFENVDTIDLRKSPITLQFKTLNEGREFYERDFIKVSNYMEYVFNRHRDEKYYLESFRKDYYDGFKL